MKLLSAILMAFSLVTSVALVAQAQPVQKKCYCKDCQCTPDNHCGCYSEAGCPCGGDGGCPRKGKGNQN